MKGARMVRPASAGKYLTRPLRTIKGGARMGSPLQVEKADSDSGFRGALYSFQRKIRHVRDILRRDVIPEHGEYQLILS